MAVALVEDEEDGAIARLVAAVGFGGYKGSSIALLVEILAGAITGGQFSFENDFTGFPGAQTPKAGQLLIVIDPNWGGATNFESR